MIFFLECFLWEYLRVSLLSTPPWQPHPHQLQQKPAELGINCQTTVRAVFKQAARDFASDFAKANVKAQLTVSFKRADAVM